jgi:hypothetical protein
LLVSTRLSSVESDLLPRLDKGGRSS